MAPSWSIEMSLGLKSLVFVHFRALVQLKVKNDQTWFQYKSNRTQSWTQKMVHSMDKSMKPDRKNLETFKEIYSLKVKVCQSNLQ